jgi:hypothetical protein
VEYRVASALHWFDLPVLYKEVQTVGRRGCVLAAWSYHVAHVESPFGDVLWRFYRDIVQSYFSPGARLVDDRYEGIVLPGREIKSPPFILSVSWTAARDMSSVGRCTFAPPGCRCDHKHPGGLAFVTSVEEVVLCVHGGQVT